MEGFAMRQRSQSLTYLDRQKHTSYSYFENYDCKKLESKDKKVKIMGERVFAMRQRSHSRCKISKSKD